MKVDVSAHEFDDPDAFREHLAGWDLEIVPLSRGGLSLAWNQVAFDELIIAHHGVRGAFADASRVDDGWMFFVVCLAPTGTVWCGLELEPGHLLIMAPGREHRARIEHWESLEIVASTRLVADAGILAGTNLGPDFVPERCILPLDRAHVSAFRGLARSLEAPLQLEPWLRERLNHAIRERTLDLLRSAVGLAAASRRREQPLRVARYDLAVRALEVMDGGDEAPCTLAEIADGLGTTPRALQYALKSALGVSPYQYLLARRLQLVRRHLQRQRTTITTAAFDHGFENLGRFASQYARLFGEKPSQTLRHLHRSTAQATGGVVAAFGE